MSPPAADRRQQLAVAAAQLFRQRGFNEVGVDDIGAAVGIGGPALYRYFPSKQAVLEAVVTAYLEGLVKKAGQCRPSRAAQATADRRELPAWVLRAAVATALADPNGLVVLFRQSVQLEPAGLARSASSCAQLLPNFNRVLPPALVGHPSRAEDGLRTWAMAGVLTHIGLAREASVGAAAAIAFDALSTISTLPLPAALEPKGPFAAPGLTHRTRREAILSAATQLFGERGFTRVSLADIGAAVGVSASAVMRHFASKEELLGAAVNRAGEQIAGGIDTALRRSSTAAQAVVEIVGMYAHFAVENRAVVSINTTQAYAISDLYRRERRRRHRMYLDELANVIAQAQPQMPAAEARLRAGSVFALINEPIVNGAVSSRPGDAENLGRLALAVAFTTSRMDEIS